MFPLGVDLRQCVAAVYCKFRRPGGLKGTAYGQSRHSETLPRSFVVPLSWLAIDAQLQSEQDVSPCSGEEWFRSWIKHWTSMTQLVCPSSPSIQGFAIVPLYSFRWAVDIETVSVPVYISAKGSTADDDLVPRLLPSTHTFDDPKLEVSEIMMIAIT